MAEKIIAKERINVLMVLGSIINHGNNCSIINHNSNSKIKLFFKIASNNRKDWSMHILQFCGGDISLITININILYINNKLLSDCATTGDELSIIINFLDIDPFNKKIIKGHLAPIIAKGKNKIFVSDADYELIMKNYNFNDMYSYHITHSSNVGYNILFYKYHINNAIKIFLEKNYPSLNPEDYRIR
jgi:hypothetical protein